MGPLDISFAHYTTLSAHKIDPQPFLAVVCSIFPPDVLKTSTIYFNIWSQSKLMRLKVDVLDWQGGALANPFVGAVMQCHPGSCYQVLSSWRIIATRNVWANQASFNNHIPYCVLPIPLHGGKGANAGYFA